LTFGQDSGSKPGNIKIKICLASPTSHRYLKCKYKINFNIYHQNGIDFNLISVAGYFAILGGLSKKFTTQPSELTPGQIFHSFYFIHKNSNKVTLR
jgi:hypothetical protein